MFKEVEYGEVVSSAPRLEPSILNCTPATPDVVCPGTDGSEALAETVTVFDSVEFGVGEVRETVGGVVSVCIMVLLTLNFCILHEPVLQVVEPGPV